MIRTLLAALLTASPAFAGDVHFLGEDIAARLRILPEQEPWTSEDSTVISVTGTYSSGDRFGIEGLAVHEGDIVSRRFQEWDGVLMIDAQQELNLFHRQDVTLGEQTYDLTDRAAREEFLDAAQAEGISLLQGHLLISEGAVDVRDAAGQPRFKRRILFEDTDGALGLFDTASAVTLYDAAMEAKTRFNARMAFNLDMGTYDYCRIAAPDGATQYCGLLRDDGLDKLTNILEFRLR